MNKQSTHIVLGRKIGDSDNEVDTEVKILQERLQELAESKKHKQYQEQLLTSNSVELNIAIFDDKEAVLNLFDSAVEEINKVRHRIDIHPHVPVDAQDVVKILYKLYQGQIPPINLILIDNNFDGFTNGIKSFYSIDVLKELNNYDPSKLNPSIERKNKLHPRFLPRIVVTTVPYSPDITEQLGVAGADKVIFFKGGNGDAAIESSTGELQILNHLLQPEEWDDIRRRACHRLWRTLLIDIEKQIRKRNEPTDSLEAAKSIMSELMNFVRIWLIEAGVADVVCFRLAERDSKNSNHPLILKDVTSENEQRFQPRPWNSSPILLKLAMQDIWQMERAEFCTRKLTKAEIREEALDLLDEPGFHAIGVPLNCRHGFFGTFTMSRKRTHAWDEQQATSSGIENKDIDPNGFTTLESENIVRVAQRLALYYEQLLDATLLLRRQRGLLTLAEEMSGQTEYEKMINSAINFLHKEFHLNYELAYKINDYASAPGDQGRVTCRLLEPASGLIYRPPNTGAGIETESGQQGLRILSLDSKDSMYAKAISEGKTLYRFCSSDNIPYTKSTKIPMNTAMMEPLDIQGKILGALHVEHLQEGFYGPRPLRDDVGPSGNDNLDILKAVARVLAQSIHARRQQDFEEALIRLALSTGPEDEAKVLDNIAQALYAYSGNGVLLWCEPDANDQINVKAGWRWRKPEEAVKVLEESQMERRVLLVRMDEKTLDSWNANENQRSHVDQTFNNFLKTGEIDNYSEDEGAILTDRDTERGFSTKAQYSLILSSNNFSKRNRDVLGVLALLFRSKNAISPDQIELLQKFGNFVGTYLANVRRDKQFLGMNQKRELAEFLLALSHQVRHSLKSNLNSFIDRLEAEIDCGVGEFFKKPETLIQELKQWNVDLAATHLMPRDLSLGNVNIVECWNNAIKKLSKKSEALNVSILPMDDSVFCNCNSGIIENAFLILIDNSLDAFKTATVKPKEGCLIWNKCRESNNNVFIDVHDNGPGFTEEVRRKFGELGISTKASSGSGSGLYWCKKFLPLVNGEIISLINKNGAQVRLKLERKQHEARL